MWEISGKGSAEFRANGWKLVVTSGEPKVDGIRLLSCREDLVGASARIAVPGYELPPCGECYIRGDALHISFPLSQTNPIGLELVMIAIEADQRTFVVESVIGIHTSLLDSHPNLQLEVGSGHPGFPVWGRVGWEKLIDDGNWAWMRADARHSGEGPGVSTCLLCDHRDLTSLSPERQGSSTSVRFFGDFLEKGVIRKVQPWWVWSNGEVPSRKAREIARYLSSRPLALSN
ncbi:MAG TPA: hypothetical protein DDZ51_27210 [Planctomycetaceae bacterium]|nr:hypothetical protein [Planctomycetaceae bacterium]